jgi:hypothetical protein
MDCEIKFDTYGRGASDLVIDGKKVSDLEESRWISRLSFCSVRAGVTGNDRISKRGFQLA